MWQRRGKLHLLKWLPPLSYMLLIFIMSSRPWPKAPEIHHIDKLIHFFEYGILAILLSIPMGLGKWFLASFIATSYGVLDEIHQYFVPGRNASGWDAFANSIGALVLNYLWIRHRNRRK